MTQKEEVQFYSHHAKELKYPQQYKIMKLLEHNCIQYDPLLKQWFCNPIPGYNSSRYAFTQSKELGQFECDCQGFQKMLRAYRLDPQGAPRPNCSHVGALYETFSLMHRRRKELLNTFGGDPCDNRSEKHTREF